MKQKLLPAVALLLGTFAATAAQAPASSAAPRPRDGWNLQLVASAPVVSHPSVVCAAPDGRVFVAEDPMDISSPHANASEGRIVCLHPDGRRTVFATNLFAVFGLQYLEGRLFVLHNPKFSVFTDDDGVGRDRVDLIEQTNPDPWALDWNDHVPANFRLAMDGYFYVAVGDKGLFGAVDRGGRRVDLRGGGVIRLRPDGTDLEVVCTGVRNILDITVNEEDERFTYDNTDEHEWMGRLTHMVDGGFYGYPHDFIPRRPYTLWMLADYGPGAATGALAWNDDSLPPDWRGNLLLADFGQRNLRRVRLVREGATFRAAGDELLFPDPPADFRPVGISETADGTGFYICDWQHADTKERVTTGRLWKLTANFATNAGAKPAWYLPAAMGRTFAASTEELIGGLSHPQKNVRLTAQRALSRRGAAAGPALLAVLTNDAAVTSARWHALWALDALDGGAAARSEILRLARASTSSAPASVVRQAIRQLGQRQVRDAVPALTAQLRNTEASIRFHAATALGRIGDPVAATALVKALDERDLFARFAVFTALNRLGRAQPGLWPTLVAALGAPDPAVHEADGFALRETFDARLLQALAATAADTARPLAAREISLRLLAAVHRQPPPWQGEWWAYHPFRTPRPARTVDWDGTPIVLAALRSRLDDPEPALRRAAIEGLRDAGEQSALYRIREQFPREADPMVRLAAVTSFGEFGDSEAAPLLAALLREPVTNTELLNAVLVASGRLASNSIAVTLLFPTITNLLATTPHPLETRLAALDALGQFRRPEAVPWLVRSAQSENERERASALAALVRLGSAPALTALRPLLATDSTELRRETVGALGRLKQREAIPDLLTAWRRDDTRDAAISALAELPDLRALDAYLGGLASANAALRDKCRRALGGIANEALPLLPARREQLTPVVLGELRRVYAKDAGALASPLFTQAGRALEPADYERFALAHPGDPWRGQQHFFNLEGGACLKCHAVAGHGGTVGPDLTTIGAQFGRAALIEAILNPSKTVREGYQQYVVETRDDEEFTGAIRAETADTLTLMDTEGRLHSLPKARIKERRASLLSLMPEGLHVALTLEQFADLVAYMESLRSDPRRTEPKAAPPGFTPLFNGRDLSGWTASPHWSVRDGVLEHDGVADHLWSTRSLGDFELRLEWRWPDAPQFEAHPIINAAGYEVKDAQGAPVRERVLEAGDSGVYLRGFPKAQANLFCYPIGSGEFWEYRERLAGDARRDLTPSQRADRPIGQWNEMQVTLRGDRVTVVLNGHEVIHNARLPDLPARGPIGFQHEHGRLQLRNIFVKEPGAGDAR